MELFQRMPTNARNVQVFSVPKQAWINMLPQSIVHLQVDIYIHILN